MRKPKQVYACGVYSDFDSAIGCLLLPSLMLRSLWTSTEFRKSSMSAIERVSLTLPSPAAAIIFKLSSSYFMPSLSKTYVKPITWQDGLKEELDEIKERLAKLEEKK